MELQSALVSPCLDTGRTEEEEEETASPRVRLTAARLLDDRLQQSADMSSPQHRSHTRDHRSDIGGGEEGGTEELGSLMVNDAFDMLIKKV